MLIRFMNEMLELDPMSKEAKEFYQTIASIETDPIRTESEIAT